MEDINAVLTDLKSEETFARMSARFAFVLPSSLSSSCRTTRMFFRCAKPQVVANLKCKQPKFHTKRRAAILRRGGIKKRVDRRAGVYVLYDVKDKKMYVGKSEDMDRRVGQHLNKEGTRFFEMNGTSIGRSKFFEVKAAPIHADLESLERNHTLALMYKHGIDNVRGWMFTTMMLSSRQKEDAFRQICEKYDLCRKCGRDSHFAERCFAKGRASWATLN